MTEEPTPYGSTYQKIFDICVAALAESSPTDPALFDTITGRLAAIGIVINRKETQKGRAQNPNLVVVVQLQHQEAYLEYIELSGEDFDIYAYDGDVLVDLLTESEALRLCEPPLGPGDLEGVRYLERDGTQHFVEDDIRRIFERKEAQRMAKREEARTVCLNLPDAFLELCEEVKTDPQTVLRGFMADLCNLRSGDYSTNGSDERDLAERYFERCGYRFMAIIDHPPKS